jgi:hypothetical protein
VNFIFDENLPLRLANTIKGPYDGEGGHRVYHVLDLGLGGVRDEELMGRLPLPHPCAILTLDRHLRTREQELLAWQAHGHIAFFLGRAWQDHSFDDRAWRILRWWPEIVRAATSADRGSFVKVPVQWKPGKLLPQRIESLRRS